MKLKKSIVPIGNSPYTVIQFNYTPPKDESYDTKDNFFIKSFDKTEENLIEKVIESTEESVKTFECFHNFTIIGFTEKIDFDSLLKNFSKTIKKFQAPNEANSKDKQSKCTLKIQGEGNQILYINNKNLIMKDDKIDLSFPDKTCNRFYIFNRSGSEFVFKINNCAFETSTIKSKLTNNDIKNFLYALAYEEYCKGNTGKAIDIFRVSLKDKYLLNTILDSFTADERSKCSNLLFSAALNKKVNIKPKIWAESRYLEGEFDGGAPSDFEPCLLDVLDTFEKNGDKFLPLTSEEYSRIGMHVIDNYNVFRSDKSQNIIADFKDLVFTKDRLNISIKYTIPGNIYINPRQSKKVGFNTNIFRAKIYREQTLVRDGFLNMTNLKIFASKKTFDWLERLNIKGLYTVEDFDDSSYPDFIFINFNGDKMPIARRNYFLEGNSLDYILEMCWKQKTAECRNKVLKHFLDNENRSYKYMSLPYTREQFDLLYSYGLNSEGIYEGIDNKIVSEDKSIASCRFFQFDLKGFNNIPKVEDVLLKIKEGKRSLNPAEAIMAESITFIKENKIDSHISNLIRLLDEQKSIIKKTTKILAKIKLEKALTGGWWQDLKFDPRGYYLYEKEGRTLIVKVYKK